MTDELELRREIDRAARADALLKDDLLNEAFTAVRSAYLNKWGGTTFPETATREKLWLAITTLDLIREHLGSVMSSGSVSAKQLRNLEEARTSGRPRNQAAG